VINDALFYLTLRQIVDIEKLPNRNMDLKIDLKRFDDVGPAMLLSVLLATIRSKILCA